MFGAKPPIGHYLHQCSHMVNKRTTDVDIDTSDSGNIGRVRMIPEKHLIPDTE